MYEKNRLVLYILQASMLSGLFACHQNASSPQPKKDKHSQTPSPVEHQPSKSPPAKQTELPPPTRIAGAERIIAIGDLHGDIKATRKALRIAKVLDFIDDNQDHWIGDTTIVVQTGDQLDRGDDELAIFDLLEQLANEAQHAGGAVYVLNGNHELMNAAGDFRYVTPEGFRQFADYPGIEPDHPRLATIPFHMRGRAAAFMPSGPLALRMAKRNTILVVGDTVFVHGGVLPEHVEYGLERINRDIHQWLRGEVEPSLKLLTSDESPVWSRHYSADPDAEDCALLAETLAKIPAKRMVVGHTVQASGISSACDDQVWRIDVGMAAHYGGQPQVLEISQDTVKILPAAESNET